MRIVDYQRQTNTEDDRRSQDHREFEDVRRDFIKQNVTIH